MRPEDLDRQQQENHQENQARMLRLEERVHDLVWELAQIKVAVTNHLPTALEEQQRRMTRIENWLWALIVGVGAILFETTIRMVWRGGVF